MADSVILPAGCLLSLIEREVFHNTRGVDEAPCLGCFKRGACPVRVDQGIRFAHKIMDEPLPNARVCKRCTAPMIEWRITGSFRVWTCKAPLGSDGWGRATACGWELSEIGSHALNF